MASINLEKTKALTKPQQESLILLAQSYIDLYKTLNIVHEQLDETDKKQLESILNELNTLMTRIENGEAITFQNSSLQNKIALFPKHGDTDIIYEANDEPYTDTIKQLEELINKAEANKSTINLSKDQPHPSYELKATLKRMHLELTERFTKKEEADKSLQTKDSNIESGIPEITVEILNNDLTEEKKKSEGDDNSLTKFMTDQFETQETTSAIPLVSSEENILQTEYSNIESGIPEITVEILNNDLTEEKKKSEDEQLGRTVTQGGLDSNKKLLGSDDDFPFEDPTDNNFTLYSDSNLDSLKIDQEILRNRDPQNNSPNKLYIVAVESSVLTPVKDGEELKNNYVNRRYLRDFLAIAHNHGDMVAFTDNGTLPKSVDTLVTTMGKNGTIPQGMETARYENQNKFASDDFDSFNDIDNIDNKTVEFSQFENNFNKISVTVNIENFGKNFPAVQAELSRLFQILAENGLTIKHNNFLNNLGITNIEASDDFTPINLEDIVFVGGDASVLYTLGDSENNLSGFATAYANNSATEASLKDDKLLLSVLQLEQAMDELQARIDEAKTLNRKEKNNTKGNQK